MPQKSYRVRNWKEYNRALVNRGSITFWFTEEALSGWYEKKATNNRGRPKKYSDISIICGLTLKVLFQLPYRATEGLIRSLIDKLKLVVEVPNYTLLCKRQKQLKIKCQEKVRSKGEKLHVLVDTTGMKIYGEGEWKTRKHGASKRRVWKKLHVCFNAESQEIEACEVTDLGIQDCQEVEGLLSQVEGDIEGVTGDGAYDRFMVYESARVRGSRLIAPPQKNARTSKERPRNKHKASAEAVGNRDKVIEEVRELGAKAWKVKVGYHRRSLAETGMFRIKNLLGGRFKAKKIEHQKVEAILACRILNQMNALGMPDSVAVN